jgi:hypothetical protein
MINDSRYAAAQWLKRHAVAGNHIDFFGVPVGFPALAEGITFEPAIAFHDKPRIEEQAVRDVLRGWKKRKPEFVLVMPDYTSPPGVPYSATCPAAIYEGLLKNSFGYHLAAYFETPSIVSWIRRPALDYPSVNPPIRIFVPSNQDAL